MSNQITMKEMYSTVKFTDIYPSSEEFINDYQTIGIPAKITVENATTLFFLLYGRYGNNPIANWDENQFKYKLFSIIFQFGPTWEKKLQIQDVLRNLTEAELLTGSKAIYNHAYNPSSAPTTATLEEIDYINDQNTTNLKRGKLEGYQLLIGLLEDDVTGYFIDKFKVLFKQFVAPEQHLEYITEYEEGE